MKEKRITIPLSESLIYDIDRRGDSRPVTIERDLNSLYSLELFTLHELKDKFTDDELFFLTVHCVQGIVFNPSADPKGTMLGNIASAVDAERLYKNSVKQVKEVDKERLVKHLNQIEQIQATVYKKIEELTSFQCYVIFRIMEMLVRKTPEGHQNTLLELFTKKEVLK